jgi:hypothetical protein
MKKLFFTIALLFATGLCSFSQKNDLNYQHFQHEFVSQSRFSSVTEVDITPDDIQYWIGTGSNQMIAVFYWCHGHTENIGFAWGYRWDGSKTILNMWNDLMAADPRLAIALSGEWVSECNYNDDTYHLYNTHIEYNFEDMPWPFLSDPIYDGAVLITNDWECDFSSTDIIPVSDPNPPVIIPPTVVTEEATVITASSAILNKTITQGTKPITAEGFKWRKVSITPWLESTDGLLKDLEAETKYEFYAFAYTTSDTVFGKTLSFSTLPAENILPTVITEEATEITASSATLNKIIISGTEPITAEGFKWKKANTEVWVESTDGMLENLEANTEYIFYAFACTASDIVEGETLSFSTLTMEIHNISVNMVKIYPNPVNRCATLTIENLNNPATVIVYDLSGKMIEIQYLNSENNQTKIDFSTCANGTYVVHIISKNMNHTEKIVVKK